MYDSRVGRRAQEETDFMRGSQKVSIISQLKILLQMDFLKIFTSLKSPGLYMYITHQFTKCKFINMHVGQINQGLSPPFELLFQVFERAAKIQPSSVQGYPNKKSISRESYFFYYSLKDHIFIVEKLFQNVVIKYFTVHTIIE